jgi:hypothetical protein
VIDDRTPAGAWHHDAVTLVRQSLLLISFVLCAIGGLVGAWAVYLLLSDEPDGFGRGIGLVVLGPAVLYGAAGIGLAAFVRRRARK